MPWDMGLAWWSHQNSKLASGFTVRPDHQVYNLKVTWWGRKDLNPHVFPHWNLKPACRYRDKRAMALATSMACSRVRYSFLSASSRR